MEITPVKETPLVEFLKGLYRQFQGLKEGELFTKNPVLAGANPDLFGICLVTIDGRVYEVGDAKVEFPLEGISSVLSYAQALGKNGEKRVRERIGVEPIPYSSGVGNIDPRTGNPCNPMTRPGAILTSFMMMDQYLDADEEKIEYFLHAFSKMAGRTLNFNRRAFDHSVGDKKKLEETLASLKTSAHFAENTENMVRLYQMQSSVNVNTRDLAVIAATFANAGRNPITGEHSVKLEVVPKVLTVMATCGFFEQTGESLYRIGIPARTSVAGGIIAVLPGQFGIGIYSPLLDDRKSSVRGMKILESLSSQYTLHMMNPIVASLSVVRASFSGKNLRSQRQRPPKEILVLENEGDKIRLLELQGYLDFFGMEYLAHVLTPELKHLDFLVLNFKKVTEMTETGYQILLTMVRQALDNKTSILFTHSEKIQMVANHLMEILRSNYGQDCFHIFSDNDRALEWCEDRILQKSGARIDYQNVMYELKDMDLFAEFNDPELEQVKKVVSETEFKPMEVIIRKGDSADCLFLIRQGTASVYIPLPDGKSLRVSSFCPGKSFGEMAVLENTTRVADVVADGKVKCFKLNLQDFDRLANDFPRLKTKMLLNLGRSLSANLRRDHEIIRSLF